MTSAATKDGGSPVTLITGAGRGIGRACAHRFDGFIVAAAIAVAGLRGRCRDEHAAADRGQLAEVTEHDGNGEIISTHYF
ncbi:MAG: hypothetical protein ACO3Q7_06625, partial [Steroidobacteraceae bacterium]